ncbi:hypothetical protein COO60DRAFT_1497124 [Scenedesmus sp. NREL 46B-D3]|nr:hypothetical protein COO60DRAFT_1497124 [Scenedesmus sp. NREL 46B-D3]
MMQKRRHNAAQGCSASRCCEAAQAYDRPQVTIIWAWRTDPPHTLLCKPFMPPKKLLWHSHNLCHQTASCCHQLAAFSPIMTAPKFAKYTGTSCSDYTTERFCKEVDTSPHPLRLHIRCIKLTACVCNWAVMHQSTGGVHQQGRATTKYLSVRVPKTQLRLSCSSSSKPATALMLQLYMSMLHMITHAPATWHVCSAASALAAQALREPHHGSSPAPPHAPITAAPPATAAAALPASHVAVDAGAITTGCCLAAAVACV